MTIREGKLATRKHTRKFLTKAGPEVTTLKRGKSGSTISINFIAELCIRIPCPTFRGRTSRIELFPWSAKAVADYGEY